MMKLGVPRNRAIDSAHSPSRSGLRRLRGSRSARFSPLGRSRSRLATAHLWLVLDVFAPVARQQVVEHVVDRDSAAQAVIDVDNGEGEDVVCGHATRNV